VFTRYVMAYVHLDWDTILDAASFFRCHVQVLVSYVYPKSASLSWERNQWSGCALPGDPQFGQRGRVNNVVNQLLAGECFKT
jgi:hypothetical protein